MPSTITPLTVNLDETCEEDCQNQLFSSCPVIICECDLALEGDSIMQNVMKEIKTSDLQALVVVDLVTEEQKPKSIIELEMIKVSQKIPLKKLFDPTKVEQQGLEGYLNNLDLCKLINQDNLMEPEVNQRIGDLDKKQNRMKKYGSFSVRMFPFHKSFHSFTKKLPNIILPLSEQDILSYQKAQRMCHYDYILALPQYSEKIPQKLETTVFLNWGSTDVVFKLTPSNGKYVADIKLQPAQILIIPPRYSYKLKACAEPGSLMKLLTWNIIPKKSLPTLMQNLEDETLKNSSPFAITQTLIDYCFHQFSLIEAGNQDFMCNLANYLNREFLKELEFAQKAFNINEREIITIGIQDKKIDQCQICGKFITNYFGIYKNQVYCVKCAQEEYKIDKIYQKISKKTFQEGCELLSRIVHYKYQKESEGENVQKLMNNAVFFEFEDFCDGDFVGAYNSVHCKIHEGDSKKHKNTRQKIVQNTINRIEKNIRVLPATEILDAYSKMTYKNQVEKQLYSEILLRASNFIRKEEGTKLLNQMLPNYQEDNLKILAIQLCAKDRLDIGFSKVTL